MFVLDVTKELEEKNYYRISILRVKSFRNRFGISSSAELIVDSFLNFILIKVNSIYEACESAESNKRRLDVQILLDHNRGNRGNPNSTTLLEPIVKRFDHVNVGLYYSPKLRGFLKWLLPDRWNEVLGVQHMKIYLCDDDLIISG